MNEVLYDTHIIPFLFLANILKATYNDKVTQGYVMVEDISPAHRTDKKIQK